MKIFVVGIDHVIEKLLYFYEEMKRRSPEVKVLYFTSDTSGFSRSYKGRANIFISLPLLLPWLLLRRLLVERPTHVEIYLGRLGEVVPALILCLLMRVPITCVCRGTELREWDRHGLARRLITRWAMRQARLVILKEIYMLRIIERNKICSSSKLLEIHNAIPVSLLSVTKFDPLSSTFVFVNSLRPMRNVHVLLRAFSQVLQIVPDARLRLIGSTLETNGYSPSSIEYERELRALAETLAVGDAVTFEPFSTNAWDTVQTALAFVLPADVVWLNFALLEAMAFGLPAIVSDTEGVDRLVEDGVSGLVCRIDVASIRDKMLFALQNRDQMSSISRAARSRVSEQFSVSGVVDRILSAYASHVCR